MSNRNIDIALIYHEETKHTYSSVYREHHFLDWDNRPLSYKTYTTLDPIPLPVAFSTPELPLLSALELTKETSTPVAIESLDELAYLLYYTAGVTKQRFYPNYGAMLFRASACTGALYHIDLYLAVADLPGLPAGVYHFDPVGFALRCLRQGDYRSVLIEASGNDLAFQEASVIIVGADTFWRNAWKYRARAYRHSFWDSGTILANLFVVAKSLACRARLITGFIDASVNALLDINPAREAAIFLVGLGQGASATRGRLTVEPLHLEVEPLSTQELDYPAVRIMHEASMLENAEEVRDWLADVVPLTLPAAEHPVVQLQLADEMPSDSVADVIQRRGSARRFARADILLSQLSRTLIQSIQGIPADFAVSQSQPLNHIYLLVNAVAGLEPGVYVYHPGDVTLELLEAGDFRYEAGVLALGQEIAADASVNIYFLSDLDILLELYGNRGYRVGQLEAGILAGRMYLAAYAQGLAATGLTFFDDEVAETFLPHATDKSVMFLIALGHRVSSRT